MDVVTPLAAQLVAVLTPFLPIVLQAGKDVGTRAAEQLEDSGWDIAKQIWNRLGASLQGHAAANEAAADVASDPGDEDAQAALRLQLRKLLAEDPSLQKELAEILQNARESGTTITRVSVKGDRSVGIGRDVTGSTIITGDQPRPEPRP